MKKILLIIAVLLMAYTETHAQAGVLGAFRANYFVAANGNGANSGKYPWAPITIDKLNTLTLLPGQIVAFKRGDTITGTITVGQSGTSGKPITFTGYGNGANPVISGFTTVTDWTNEGGGIYSKTLTVESNPEIATVNDVQFAKGRTPNSNRYAPVYADYYHIDDNISGTVTSVADYSGTVAGTILITTSAAHNITTGDYVRLALSPTTYDGSYTATAVNSTQFYVTK